MDRVPSDSDDSSFRHVNAFNSNDSLPSSSHFPDLSTHDFDDSFSTTPFLPVSSETNDAAFNCASALDDLGGGLSASAPEQGPNISVKEVPGNESPSHSNDSSSSDPILKFISQMLMEEKMEEMPWVFPGDSALQDTEKSFRDLISENPLPLVPSPQSLDEFDVTEFIVESPDRNVGTTTMTNLDSSTSVDDLRESNNHAIQEATAFPSVEVPQVNSHYSSQLAGNVLMMDNSSVVLKNIFGDAESVIQFNKGVEEARKFLPSSSKFLINFDNNSSVSEYKKENVSRGRKIHEREEDSLFEEEARLSKLQSASNVDESEFSEWFDQAMLWNGKGDYLKSCSDANRQIAEQLPSNSRAGRERRGGNNSSVDLRSLLVLCAQAVSTYNLRTANELLKQIRQHSSPNGDGSERLAHYFANGLEARLAGTLRGGTTLNYYASIATKKVSVAEVLRSYSLYLSLCPFMKFPIVYGNFLISKMAQKASVLHIIDFGIAMGFQWPILIQQLGERTKEGHPPLEKLRITGIELPQPGFRPAEKIEETGRRLAIYCDRFGVPFEFNAIPSRNWETIRVEDLKLERNEMVAVNSLIRLKNLSDEEDSARDAVLNLIRKIKPDVFVHVVSNGSYNAPFFVTRFKEALFHLSSIFDMFESTIPSPSDNEMRVVLEREFYGREIMNVVACEGQERVDRPESYKKWQVRHRRMGFKQLPIFRDIVDRLRIKLKRYFHKDFVVDEDGDWMLLGWKGRILYATACWVPA